MMVSLYPNGPLPCMSYEAGCKCSACMARERWSMGQWALTMGINKLSPAVPPPYHNIPQGPPPPLAPKYEAIVIERAAQYSAAVTTATVIGPQICTKCHFKNDYAGPEHLQKDGTYVCRECK